MLYLNRFAITQSIPAITSLARPSPFESSTLTLISIAPGATPTLSGSDASPLAATMPATCVPWPNLSCPFACSSVKSTLARTLPRSSGTTLMPESRMATAMPEPVSPGAPATPACTRSAPIDALVTLMCDRTV